MTLADHVRVRRRFQRSIRIDTDLSDPDALNGFICPQSSAVVLETMARHAKETSQAAFTWTGPYGTGKSSLAIALSAVLNGKRGVREVAADILGERTAGAIWGALPPLEKGWRVLPVVGSRENPVQALGKALEQGRFVRRRQSSEWSESDVLEALLGIAKRTPKKSGGLIVFIDEMGKFLEGAAYEGNDIYFFQQLAELASRSNSRLIVVGILHQAFEEYAHRLSREMRDEWAKIQGRFIDLAVNTGPDEQLELLGRAIESDCEPCGNFRELSSEIATLTGFPSNADLLASCWPLDPVVASLLGPISRRRFGQNQRSIFGFLNSTEPHAFQDFLRSAERGALYPTDTLWDYLRVNLEPSIMASPDGHRWAMAAEAMERCHASGRDDLQIRLLKIIGLIDLFRERSGLLASQRLFELILGEYDAEEIKQALTALESASIVIFRKFSSAYSVFEGSDFDIEKAVDDAYGSVGELDYTHLTNLAGLQPIIAKKHYHNTGALRWFDLELVPLNGAVEAAAAYEPKNNSAGAFLLALPSLGDSAEHVERIAQQAAYSSQNYEIVVGVPDHSTWSISTLARDLMALEHVRDNTLELQGDRVARAEVQARIAELRGGIEEQLSRAMGSVVWYREDHEPVRRNQAELNILASEIADSVYSQAPRIHNELLNRIKPSGNAVAARNILLRRMTLHGGEERLGIDGYPAEGGLFDSLLNRTALYSETEDGWQFTEPSISVADECNLHPAWGAAVSHLEKNADRNVPLTEIYAIWKAPPFGIKDGLLPVLGVALILTRRREVALYREGIFQPYLTDLDVDYLSNDPSDIQLRWMELSDLSRQLLSDMAAIVRDLDRGNTLHMLEPIDVARGLVSIYANLPAWVDRTQRLSENAKQVRRLFKQASDPNRFIFDDIPQLVNLDSALHERTKLISAMVRDGLSELSEAYPAMLRRLREVLLAELGVPNASPSMLGELRDRAENIRQISGDHRLEAFILRIAQFEGTDDNMESLASMAANKPPRQWVDSDIDRTTVELAELAQSFKRHEAFAHVHGRQDHRLAMAVVVGINGQPIHDEFEITSSEEGQVDDLIRRFRGALQDSGEEEQNVILAALARVMAEYLEGRGASTTKAKDEAG